MKFKSLASLFVGRKTRKSSQHNRRPGARRERLHLEQLERRELLSNVPFIKSVVPVDGSVTGAQPTLAVTYSEPLVQSQATNTANYVFFGPSGAQITINSASAVINADNTETVTLSYNNGNPLAASQYSLFVRGDQIHDIDDNFPLAQPGQLVVANSGSHNVSLVNMPGNGLLQALTNYASPGTPTPSAAVIADVTGDGIPDLIVANSSNDTISIFQGLNLPGGGFADTPYTVFGTGGNPSAMLVADFNGLGPLDLAVTNKGDNNVEVFLNNGQGIFSIGTTYATGNGPVAIAAADFDFDGTIDLAVANSGATTVTVLPGVGDGTFGTAVTVNAPGIGTLTGIAAGDLNQDFLPDLALSGSGGVATLINQTPFGKPPAFSAPHVISTVATTSVAIGELDTDSFLDIAATTSNNGGQVLVFTNLGNASFGAPVAYAANANPTGIMLAPVYGSTVGGITLNDILVVNDVSTGTVSVLANQSGTSFASPVSYRVDSTPVGLGIHLNAAGVVDELASANQGGGDASFLRPKGDGTFFTSTDLSLSTTTISAVATADLNGDGIPDLVIADRASNNIEVLLSQSNGTYGAPTSYAVGTAPDALAIGDINGDGFPDILVANSASTMVGGVAQSTVSILDNDGTGHFTAQAALTVPAGPTALLLADFNGDGKLDLAVAHNGDSTNPQNNGVSVFLHDPINPGFLAPTLYLSRTNAVGLAAANFDVNGRLDLAVLDGSQAGTVTILHNTGTGTFFSGPQDVFPAGEFPTSIAVGDLNRDGRPDIVVANHGAPPAPGGPQTAYISVLINTPGVEFNPALRTDIFTATNAVVQSVAVVSLDQSLYPDVVASVVSGGVNNIVALQGAGDGTLQAPRFYGTSGGGSAVLPSFLAVVSDPFMHATTFRVQGNIVASDLVVNGTFDRIDLAGEKGNLVGWQTFAETGSAGQWQPQTGSISPLSAFPVPLPPEGQYAAMLDEPNLALAGASAYGGPFQSSTDYNGMHILYQDVFVPTGTVTATLSFALYINNTAGTYTNAGALDYFPGVPSPPPNQMVRVDIMDPLAPINDVGSGVLQNVFITTASTPAIYGYTTTTVDLTGFAGKTIRLRFAEVNNQGQMLVGLDNVQLKAFFADISQPALTGLRLRNPGFGATATFGGNSTDPTIIGRVSDIGSPNNIAFIEIDPDNDGFTGGDEYFISALTNSIDAVGNFQTTLPALLPNGQDLLPGNRGVGIKVVNKAGLSATGAFVFDYQGPSTTAWQAKGPGPIVFAGLGTDYTTVSGHITSIAVDPSDHTGNTYYVGSDNGGVWKTTDGGNNWTPLTDNLTDPTLGNLAVPISALAVDPNHTQTVYAATGIPDNALLSHPGYGILKSTDGGQTWTVVGKTTFTGARIAKMVINSLDTLFVAVASGGQFGPGLYSSSDGGSTWTNLMTTGASGSMFLDGGGHATGPLASVTDVQIDTFSSSDENMWVGVGNLGLAGVPVSGLAGLWFTDDHGTTWQQIVGGHDPMNSVEVVRNQTILSGTGVGRVTIALPTGSPNQEGIVYVMMSTPGSGSPPPSSVPGANDGTSFHQGATGQTGDTPDIGLFKTHNGGLSWTHVMLKENVPDEPNEKRSFENLSTLGREGSDAAALVVDPNNANVIYLGGSTRVLAFSDAEESYHGLLRIDTSDMRDTSYVSPYIPLQNGLPVVPNDGDDIIKAALAASNAMGKEPGSYPKGAPGGTGGYAGEGVFWYDLATTDFGAFDPGFFFTPHQFVPDPIHALVFDGQGRLLAGTEAGLWRGVSQGFVYDLTEQGTGIGAAYFATPSEPGMTFTNLNGNLQIADMTSVAIDPLDRNALDSTQASTGWALASGKLQWTTTNDSVVEAPFTGDVFTGPVNPNAEPGTLTIVYRTHSLAVFIPNQIEKSIVGGGLGTFSAATNGLGLGDIRTSVFLPLAVNPVHQSIDSGDALMFWTNKIYESDNSTFTWDPNSPVLPPSGDAVTALAFGPSAPDAFYVGTQQGRVFVDLNDGAQGYPERDAGLPREPIEGITVDPTNASIAYVMMGGFGTGKGHVFKTTNAGQSWTNITANLQDVPAYAMAIDPRALPGLPGQRLYVGTEVGAYFSTDGGASWQRLGVVTGPNGTTLATLPNVPVRDIQFNAGFEKLVIATEGRGAFELSTDVIGPHVIAIIPPLPTLPGVSSVTVTFNHPVDPRTFTAAQVQLVGPFGPITPVTVTDEDPVNHLTFQITFPQQNADGAYNLVLSPTIKDFIGNPMDQDGDGINGGADDAFTGVFAINSTDNGRFVTGAYHDLLNRAADTPGFLYTLNSLGVDPARWTALGQMALSMVTSPEARGDTIYDPFNGTGLYPQLLGRPAQQFEINYWVQAYQLGARREDVLINLASSDSYYNQSRVGSNDTGFANTLYNDLLQRPPTMGEVNAVTQPLAAAEMTSRLGVANYLDQSAEYDGDLVYNPRTGTGLYPTFLRRKAGSSEINYWVSQLQGGQTTNEGIIDVLVGSDEYFKNPLIKTPDTPNGTDGTNPTWIKALYNDLLHRSPDQNGFNYLLSQLQAGMSRGQVALILINSDEYHRDVIYFAATGKGYFPEFLQRAPSATELTNLATALDNGLTDEALISYLVSTPEYFGLHAGGATTLSQMDVNFVKAAYLDLLARAADSNGLAFFTQQLDLAEVTARARIVHDLVFSTTNEYLTDVITATYMANLGRAPAASEINFWLPTLRQPGVAGQPNGDEMLQIGVLSSQEYFYRQRDANGLAEDGQWLQSVWSAVLTRTPDAASFNAGLFALLSAYQPQRLAVSSLLVNSLEHDDFIAETFYMQYLRRAITPAELASVGPQLQSGQLTDEQLIATLVSSTEYFTNPNLGASNNSTWLNQIYLDLFGRTIDAAGEAYWLNQLNSGTTRFQVATDLLVQDEYRHRLIEQFYTTYLGRAAVDAEVASWTTFLKNGGRDEQIIAALIASNEYMYQPTATSGGVAVLRSHPFP